jgi:FG-GAP repeat
MAFLSAGIIGLIGAACNLTHTTTAPENGAMPTSRPRRMPPLTLSARLVERIENPDKATKGSLHFGGSIALHGNTLAVGAPDLSGLEGYQKGIVFIFKRTWGGWEKVVQLAASDQEDGFQTDLHFGDALALSEDTLMVGAPGANDRPMGMKAGAVYVFDRFGNTWQETGILRASDSKANAAFGSLIKLREDVLLVGGGFGGQEVYVFERRPQGWVETARLTGDQTAETELFGYSLAISKDRLAVSAVHYELQHEGEAAGEVYLFQRHAEGWAKETVITIDDAGGNIFNSARTLGSRNLFNGGLDIDAQTLVVGNPDERGGFMSGAVIIYEYGPEGWKLQDRLTAGDAFIVGGFGFSLDLEGDILAVGAGLESSQGLGSGAVYLYRRQGGSWQELLKLWPAEQDYEGSYFGRDLALSGDTLLVAAPGEFGNAVYIYEVKPR